MNTKYEVIWIDDEWEKMEAFKEECEAIHQIILHPFKTQKAGMEALDSNLKKWDAIILDAKMFDKSEDNEVPKLDGLRNAINHINQVSLRRKIPYFISTGQPDLMDNETFEQVVGHFYIKERDDLKLISDLKEEVDKSTRRQIKFIYNDVIEQLSLLNNQASDIILDIFESMHYPDSHPDFNPILFYNQLRQILEYNFRAANKVCIIPDNCFDDNGEPILGECSRYLNGRETKYTKVKVRYGQEGDRVVPPHIELLIRMVLEIGNINSHSTKLSDTELQELEQYFNKNVFNSRYLIYSLALNVCEITLWFKNYINSHQNIEKNKKMCRPISDNQTTSKNIDKTDIKEDELIGVVMCDNGIYHIGSRFFVNKSHIDRNNLLDKKVRIVEHDINSNSGTKEQYPYFACKVKLINE
jgi:hypothetical protein